MCIVAISDQQKFYLSQSSRKQVNGFSASAKHRLDQVGTGFGGRPFQGLDELAVSPYTARGHAESFGKSHPVDDRLFQFGEALRPGTGHRDTSARQFNLQYPVAPIRANDDGHIRILVRHGP